MSTPPIAPAGPLAALAALDAAAIRALLMVEAGQIAAPTPRVAPEPQTPVPAPPPSPVAVATQAAASRQTSLAPLFADIKAALGSAELPAPVAAAAALVQTLAAPLDPPPTGADLKAAMSQSGLLLEATLAATGAPPPADLKAALLVLRQTLAATSAETPQQLAAPPAAPAPPSAPPVAQTAPAAQASRPAAAPAPPTAQTAPVAAASPSAVAPPSAPQAAQTTPDVAASPSAAAPSPASPVPQTASEAPAPPPAPAPAERVPASTPPPVRGSPVAQGALPAAAPMPASAPSIAEAAVAPAVLLAEPPPAVAAPLAAPVTPPPTPSRADTPPPYRDGPLHSQPVATAQIAADAPAATLVRALLHGVDGALARQVLFQLASLPDVARAQGDASARQWAFELPLATPAGVTPTPFEISRDGGQGAASDRPGAPTWRARFSLDLGGAGPVHAHVSLQNGRARVNLWADQPDTAAALEAGRAALATDLSGQNFEPTVAVFPGQPASPAADPGRFLDRAL